MTKVIYYRFFLNQWKIDLHFFSKSSNAKARKASAKAISKRLFEAIEREQSCKLKFASKKQGEDHIMPYYQKIGEIPRKHHIWFHRNGAGPSYKNEGIDYEHVVTTEGFNEAFSIMLPLPAANTGS